MKNISIFPTVILTLIVAACATTPTGRHQLLLVSDSEMNQMGAQSFDQMKKETPVETDLATNNYVKCVANAIVSASKAQLGNITWEIVVFKDNTANAFALPGGKIGVHTGILPVAKTDAQLAAVLGHEVGHVIAKHGASRVSQGLITQGGTAILTEILAGKSSGSTKQMIAAGLGLGAQYGVLLPYGRADESEADLIGLDLMSRAGFDPRQSVELWNNMKAASGGKAPPEWMSTHPANDTRIRALQDHMAENLSKYEQARRSGIAPHCTR
ncbi:MAG: M48 family metallopeptidase [Bdellovibrionales bacterium]|nr:M48 family metallopeptidase [Bdellovibrionales bacterium]